jgi:hypothetical protein
VRVDLRYHGTSGVRESPSGALLAFAPNLARPRVFFDGRLADPVRFREAISALHEVVVGELRARKKDRTAYQAWLESEKQREAALREALVDHHKREELARLGRQPMPPNLAGDFRRMHDLYWTARRKWAAELAKDDVVLFRHLVPCDPVVTVAPDVVFFEAFAKDESSYGCLTVGREAFEGAQDAGLGTTNVDYSLVLYEHFQTLRTYRPARLQVDPSGFDVEVTGVGGVREEKIDLPPSWLRGFGQLQAAMALPSDRVALSVDAVYSLLAFLRRHREKKGPRSVRFELSPGKPPVLVLDPWGVRIDSHGPRWEGDARTVKIWGRRRLFALARLLPLAERFDVVLLGSGMPSFWVAHMREMRFVLALSGWTANDWTAGSNLDQRFATFRPDAAVVDTLARYLETARSARFADMTRQVPSAPRGAVLGSLHELAKRGQLAYDFGEDVVRWRPILPVALSEALLGPESPEIIEGRRLAGGDGVHLVRDEDVGSGRRLLVAKVDGTSCEGILDADGGFTRAKCSCSFFHRTRLRAGPCRHLLALRGRAMRLSLDAPRLQLRGAQNGADAAEEAAGQRSALVLQLPSATLDAMTAEAARRGWPLDDIAEQAWRIARDRIGREHHLEALGAPAAGRAVAKVPQSFALRDPIAGEIQREAARLDVSVSAVFAAAWALAEGAMRRTSSLLD